MSSIIIWLAASAIFVGVVGQIWADDGEEIDFAAHIRPLLERHCIACHGPDKQKSGLRLDIKQAAWTGGDGYGPAIVAGEPDTSPLFQLLVTSDASSRMPLDAPPLTDTELANLRSWIQQGAPWPDGIDTAVLEDRTDHWSFKPLGVALRSVAAPSPQPVRSTSSAIVTPAYPPVSAYPPVGIDEFIVQQLTEHGLALSPPAARRDWLRRVSLDLLGLPPPPAAMLAFEHGTAPEDFSRVVDELLASPRYGERYAQHWLDVVRYADTDGFEVNTPRPNAWPFRDYVIQAFNADTPYDQFIREQLVGDAYGIDAATGFLVTAAALLPGQIGQDDVSKRLARQDELAEIVINTGEAFLGLSIGCARCHDHKFDAVSQRDYYALQAFYSGVRYGERPLSNGDAQQRQLQRDELTSQIEQLDQQLAARVRDFAQPTLATGNEINLAPRAASLVRFTIHDANRHPSLGLIEPCIDEFEIFDTEGNNVALATHGTRVSASGSRISDRHQLEFVRDGRYGNSASWMSEEAGRGWLLFELPAAVPLAKIVWSRDRTGEFHDRLPTLSTLELGTSPEEWTVIAGPTAEQLFDWQQLTDQRRELLHALERLGAMPMVFAGNFGAPEPCFRLLRGDPEQPLEPVVPAVPTALGDLSLPHDAPEQDRRRALANWIAHSDHPLTSRVMVNRIWQWHFGTGLVSTPSDFGRQGERPSHPQLLDWLAAEFIRSGWSMKHIHRLIVLSDTYRQSNQIDATSQAVDASARLLWRYPARRLEAETIRDCMLDVSGQLQHIAGGPGFDLFTSRGGLSGFPPIESFNQSGLRRLIYAHKVRMERDAVFGAFDCPDAGQSLPRRGRSTTPTQALNLFNSQFTLDAAEAMAARVLRDTPATEPGARIERAFWLALGRAPHADELEDLTPLVQQAGLASLCRALFNSNEFLFIP